MVRKVNVLVFITVLFAIEAYGFRLFDTISSSFEDEDDSDVMAEYDPDPSDYWDALLDSSDGEFDGFAKLETDKWIQIDNLQLNDDVGMEVEDGIVEIVQMRQYSDVKGVMKYQLGKHVRGDKPIAFSAKNVTWPTIQDVKTNMTYPGQGVTGKKLTFVEIQVNQTSNLGQAYVVRGGIGKRFVTIVVEAYHTLYFHYKTTFYGL